MAEEDEGCHSRGTVLGQLGEEVAVLGLEEGAECGDIIGEDGFGEFVFCGGVVLREERVQDVL